MHQKRDRTYAIGLVTVTRHPVDWAELGPEFGELAGVTFERLKALPDLARDHRYLNPMFSLYAPGEVPADVFLAQAARACLLWMRQLRRVAGYRRVRRFQLRESTSGERGLLTSGLLILGGRFVHIKRLNEATAK